MCTFLASTTPSVPQTPVKGLVLHANTTPSLPSDGAELICKEVWAMRDGRLEAPGTVEGQGFGPRIDKKNVSEENQFDTMGNKVDTKRVKKITHAN